MVVRVITMVKAIKTKIAVQLIVGTPKNSARGNALNASVISWLLTHLPSEIRNIIPRKMVIVPSVTTIGGISSFQTSMPLKAPIKVPRPIATIMITTTGTPGATTLIIATTIPVKARFAATLKSMHFVNITII